MKKKFEWDEKKSKANHQKHGVTFEQASKIWEGNFIEFEGIAKLKKGEERKATLGKIKEKIYAVIWTQRKEKIRIISTRRARKSEESLYSSRFQDNEING